MKKHKFTDEERFAIWRVYERKCFYCKQPLTLAEVTIDHLIPEHLLDDNEQLQSIKSQYGQGADFSINDYCNWVPAHLRCNQDKGTIIFQPSPIFLTYLARARRKAILARQEAERFTKNMKSGEVLGRLGVALQGGIVQEEDVIAILQRVSSQRDQFEPIVITFSLSTEEALRKGSPEVALPEDYPGLCDWLEKDLVKQLSALLTCSFYYPEASERTGETLSVRLAFLQLNLNELETFTSPWWEIVEIQYFSEIYGNAAWARLRHKTKMQNAPVLGDGEFLELLFIGGMLMNFTQVTETDYRAVAISQDHMLYQSDSYYDLDTWREILERARIEDWEIEQALSKVDSDLI
jgi:hypothetical protein